MPEGDAAAVAAAAAAAASKPWYQSVAGVDQEIVGHWQNAGWINKKPEEIALEATKSWKAAERNVGVPADQIVRLPKDPKDELGWKQVWQRLGAPKEAKEYDFTPVKRADGTAPEEGFQNTMREAAFRLNLPKDAALQVTSEVIKYLDSQDSAEKAELSAKLIEQKAALKKNWGPNEAANTFVANRAAAVIAEKLGVDPAKLATNALEGVLGYDKIMEMFRMIGAAIGEDKFVNAVQPGTQGGVMTREQAVAKRTDVMNEVKAGVRKVTDPAVQRELLALNTIIIA